MLLIKRRRPHHRTGEETISTRLKWEIEFSGLNRAASGKQPGCCAVGLQWVVPAAARRLDFHGMW